MQKIISKQLLLETFVKSSWLRDISFYGVNNYIYPGESIITFQCKRYKDHPTKTYVIRGFTKKDFDEWLNAYSKGKHWWRKIKPYINADWFYKGGKDIKDSIRKLNSKDTMNKFSSKYGKFLDKHNQGQENLRKYKTKWDKFLKDKK